MFNFENGIQVLYTVYHSTLQYKIDYRILYTVYTIEEGFIKKPRQTVVVAFWGKMATHMLLFSQYSRQIVTRQAGSKLRGGGGICKLHFL